MDNDQKAETDMRKADLTQRKFFVLSLKGWKWLAFPALFFWIAAAGFLFLMCSEAVELHRQKSESMVLTAVASGRNTDLQTVNGVVDWSETYEVSGRIQIMNYQEECSITGVDRDFISASVKEGDYYPEDSGMPYLLVNQAFLKQMTDANGNQIEDTEEIDWLSKTVTIAYGENKSMVCKICGILNPAEENESPLIYMSPDSAKNILQTGESISEENSLWIKIKSGGEVEQVQADLSQLGITVNDIDESLVWTWKMQALKITYFCLIAVISGLAAWLLFFERLRIDALRNKEEYEVLQSIESSWEKEECESIQSIESAREKEERESYQRSHSFRGNVRKRMNCCRSIWLCVTGLGVGLLVFLMIGTFIL